jgi:hypothetical protein
VAILQQRIINKILRQKLERDDTVAVRLLRHKMRSSLISKSMLFTAVIINSIFSIFISKSGFPVENTIIIMLPIIILSTDELLFGYRINNGSFANNEHEARELLMWIESDSSQKSDSSGPPPRGLVPEITPRQADSRLIRGRAEQA